MAYKIDKNWKWRDKKVLTYTDLSKSKLALMWRIAIEQGNEKEAKKIAKIYKKR